MRQWHVRLGGSENTKGGDGTGGVFVNQVVQGCLKIGRRVRLAELRVFATQGAQVLPCQGVELVVPGRATAGGYRVLAVPDSIAV